jgi:CDP-diacylglycerol--glycerol-3-phosphate 3-phosphatidyltransferase/cardiolipin synthase
MSPLFNLPNILTLLRIVLIPVFVIAYYSPLSWHNVLATAIFGLAAITDWFDGWLARRYNQSTPFGAFLDPVADKLMVATALVLMVQHYADAYLAISAAVIIGREITISALREWMAELGQRAKVAVSQVGKVKTTMQMIALFMLLYEEPLFGLPIRELGYIAIFLAAALTLWSMIVYLRAALPALLKSS